MCDWPARSFVAFEDIRSKRGPVYWILITPRDSDRAAFCNPCVRPPSPRLPPNAEHLVREKSMCQRDPVSLAARSALASSQRQNRASIECANLQAAVTRA